MSKSKAKGSRESRQYPFDRHSWRFLDYGTLEDNLIAEVKKETVLYDKKCSAYRKSEATEEAWKRISDVLGVSVDSCKKRWKSLRDCFIKHYRAELIAKQQKQENKKSWAYFDNMTFLSKHVQLYRVEEESDHATHDENTVDVCQDTTGAENGLPSDEASSDANFEEGYAEYIQIEEVDDLGADTSRSERLGNPISVSTHYKAMSTRSRASDMPAEERHQTLLTSITNSDERFLLSCAPALVRLTKRKNALVRLKIQQLLYDMEFGDDNDEEEELARKKKSKVG